MTLVATLLLALALPQEPIPLLDVLAVPPLGERRRSAVYTDGLEAELLRGFRGGFSAPEEGELARAADGTEHRWRTFTADDKGWFSGPPFRGGWAYAALDVPETGAWRLVVRGPSFVLVDGAPRGGDRYNLGITALPLALSEGRHDLFFRCGRGRLQATLEPAPAPVYIEERDRTLPDFLRGERESLLAGLVIANASPDDAWGLRCLAAVGELQAVTPLPWIHASSFRKCKVQVPVPEEHDPEREKATVVFTLQDREGETLHRMELELLVRDPRGKHVRTFESEIDGSVQYYGVTPPAAEGGSPEGNAADDPPALFLTLHGAGVEARRQASAYRAKQGGYVVAPTNRRPFGFDWEDWGRLDALEVLAQAERRFGTDPRRTYLTGHSMGGHGTWQLGAHFPARFAAIAPSAGWRDFWAYGGGGEFPATDPIGALLLRAVNASRTLLLERNLRPSGIYVLHGDEDRTVSVNEARAMRERLAAFHANFAYYERVGAGHWWGDQCMDWPPLFEFLEQNVLPDPAQVREVDFTTVSPAISDRMWWVRIENQLAPMEPSRIRARFDPEAGTVHVEERTNVARFSLAREALPVQGEAPLQVRVGDETFTFQGETPVALEWDDGAWQPAGPPDPGAKGPHRHGPFKDAFRHRMVFVYGTAGSPEENAWAFDKARFDHETWRYRGNGAVDLVADRDFDTELFAERSVVLYGNQDTNQAWRTVLDAPPFALRRGELRVGERTLKDSELAFLAVYPRSGSERAAVAVVGGTGLVGCRITNFLPYFVSGVGYPDWTVLEPAFLTRGLEGVRGAGYFDRRWSLEDGEASWRESDK